MRNRISSRLSEASRMVESQRATNLRRTNVRSPTKYEKDTNRAESATKKGSESFLKSESEIAYEEKFKNQGSGKFEFPQEISCFPRTMIFISALFFFGAPLYYYDYPQLFENTLIAPKAENGFGFTPIQVSLLYTAIAAPALVTTIWGHSIVDKFGLRFSGIIFNFFCFIGVVITHFGVHKHDFWLMFAGRVLYGAGYDLLTIFQAEVEKKWFMHSGYWISLILNYGITNLTMAAGAFLQTRILIWTQNIEYVSIAYTGVSFAVCAFAVLFALLDKAYEKKIHGFKEMERQKVIQKKNKKSKYGFGFCDLFKVGLLPWMILVVFLGVHMLFYQFTNFATNCLSLRFGLKYKQATVAVSVIPFLQIPLAPIFAKITSKFGKKGISLVVSSAIACGTYFFMMILDEDITKGGDKNFEQWQIYLALLGIVVFFSIFSSSVWTSLALSVHNQAVEKVLTWSLTLLNLFYSVLPPFFAYLNYDKDYEAYQQTFLSFFIISVVCLIFSIVIAIYDFCSYQVLHLPEDDLEVAKIRDKWSADFIMNKIRQKKGSEPQEEYEYEEGQGVDASSSSQGANRIYGSFGENMSDAYISGNPGYMQAAGYGTEGSYGENNGFGVMNNGNSYEEGGAGFDGYGGYDNDDD